MEIDSNALGFAFILLGMLLFIIEIFQPGFLIAVPATVCFAIGILVLTIPWALEDWYAVPIIVSISCITLYFTLKFYQSLGPPDTPPTGGITEHIGQEGTVIETVDESMRGRVNFGLQKVRARADRKIPIGTRVRVIDAQGIHVVVKPLDKKLDNKQAIKKRT